MIRIKSAIFSVVFFIFSTLAISPLAYAQDPIHKMGRGIGNMLTCWLELFNQLEKGKQEDNPFSGIGKGLVKGGTLTVTRLAIGAYETVTFFLPYPKEFNSPYTGMELPDYAWE